MNTSWRMQSVLDLQRDGLLLVEDGNHGEYRPRRHEFVDEGHAFIRAADMHDGRVLFSSAQKINEDALQRIRKGIGKPGDVLFSHKGTVGKLAMVPDDSPPFVGCMNANVFLLSFWFGFSVVATSGSGAKVVRELGLVAQ